MNASMAAMNSVHLGNFQKTLNSFVFRRCMLSNNCLVVARYSTESEVLPYAEKNEEEIAKIEEKRNKSGLRRHDRNLMEEHRQLPEIKFRYQLTQKYQRKLYATFGRASGIEPSIMWPTKEELKDMIEQEKEFCPTLEEMLQRRREARKKQEEITKKREESVEYNLSKLGKWLEELKQRRDKKLAAIQAEKDKKEALIEDVRQYFGYRLSPKDPKFVEILEKKEMEEKKIAKEAKKKEKFAREIARLANLAQSGTQGTATKEKTPKNTSKASTPPEKEN